MTVRELGPELDALVAQLAPLIARFPSLRGERLPGIALIVQARTPEWRTTDPQLLAARYLIWIFGVDDLSDDRALRLPALLAHHAGYRAVARGAAPTDALGMLLAELLAGLQALPLWPALADTWLRSFDELLAGMAAERRPEPPASLEAYMAYAHLSIGAMQDAWTVLLTLGDTSALSQLAAIGAALQAEARVIRLANDLNSAEKERAEGKHNALTLLAAQGHARAHVEAELTRALDAYRQARAQVRTATGRFEQAIDATVETTLAFYRRFTFHEFNHRRS
ncbi:MAG: terpene synthase family protein [Kouleothrix sp.]